MYGERQSWPFILSNVNMEIVNGELPRIGTHRLLLVLLVNNSVMVYL